MLIKSIMMNNFRQFKGKQKLEFSTDSDKNVTVLLGDNTFGKTTILQAFNWCLYGVADFPKDSNPDFLLNLEIANEQAGIQQKCEVSVELILEHKDTEYIVLRKQAYIDRAYGSWNALNSQLLVSYKENGITKQVREGEEKNIINAILPQSLSGYFFFDTERVSDISTRKDLSEAVRGLLGLAAVGNARKHLGTRTQKATTIGQWNGSLDSSGDERAKEAQETISKETDKIESLKSEIENAERELENLNNQKEKIAEILRDNQSTAELQRQKQTLEGTLEKEKKELEDSNKNFLRFFSSNAVSYLALPLVDQAQEVLINAHVDDRGNYYTEGLYVIDVPAIDEKDIVGFKEVLAIKNFWFTDELEREFKRVCVNSSEDAFNSAAFKRIGYSLNMGYAYNNIYSSVISYFDAEVFSADIVDLNELDRRLVNLSVFNSALYKKKMDLEYIEVAPKILMSISQVEHAYGISLDEVKKLQEWVLTCEDKYYNAHSLWNKLSELECSEKLQNNEWMCTCIFRQQVSIASLQVAGGIILCREYSELNFGLICKWLVEKHGRMTIQNLTSLFNDTFSTRVPVTKIAEKMKAYGLWETFVTDSFDEYIDNLVIGTESEIDEDDLFQEEFF